MCCLLQLNSKWKDGKEWKVTNECALVRKLVKHPHSSRAIFLCFIQAQLGLMKSRGSKFKVVHVFHMHAKATPMMFLLLISHKKCLPTQFLLHMG
jgi:hypothetical protein